MHILIYKSELIRYKNLWKHSLVEPMIYISKYYDYMQFTNQINQNIYNNQKSSYNIKNHRINWDIQTRSIRTINNFKEIIIWSMTQVQYSNNNNFITLPLVTTWNILTNPFIITNSNNGMIELIQTINKIQMSIIIN
jgi:hypothetical protein